MNEGKHREIPPANVLVAGRVDVDSDNRLRLGVAQPRQGAVEAPHLSTPPEAQNILSQKGLFVGLNQYLRLQLFCR